MSGAAVVGIVVAISAGYVGGVWVVVRSLGARITDQGVLLGARIDDLRSDMNARFAEHGVRLDRVDAKLEALGRTVAEHEGRLKG
jgi:uncharacterized protein YneF (UPF0154 family)